MNKCNSHCKYFKEYPKLGVWCKKTGLGIRAIEVGKACTSHISEEREKELKRLQVERRLQREKEQEEARRILSRSW